MSQFDADHDGRVTFMEYMDAICGEGWKVDKAKASVGRNEASLLLQSVSTRLYHTQSWTRESNALLNHFKTFDKDCVGRLGASRFYMGLECLGLKLTSREMNVLCANYTHWQDGTIDYKASMALDRPYFDYVDGTSICSSSL